MQTAAVLPARGIGDALLMMIAAHQLLRKGYRVTTFHPILPELSSWFPGHDLQPSISSLASFDLILAENDNSAFITELLGHHRDRLSLFYPTYSADKHAPLTSLDRIFDPNRPMADNIAEAISSLIDCPLSKHNGLSIPDNLIHRTCKQQIILHPTSSEEKKNWHKKRFIRLAHALKERGLSPLFCVSPKEQSDWEFVKEQGLALTAPPTLSSLAALLYESSFMIGNDSLIGHLASNLEIPTLIIADNEKRMKLWRPGWLQGGLALPPPYLPNWKPFRQQWHLFVSVHHVLRRFDKLTRAF